ncbi:hypothetical protein Strain138_002356 [Pseudogemmatithrix spongiicola]|uniref:Uncharacterized protein n=1 Tax=Pseudogemmatithrix spongiicola TaxID=3062599 RepID=A0AA49K2E3_9BACT|nr:hypothetical protein Strain138_002356 [Gemmatimonadaceae bacterium 'strain 138']WKW15948.1 hypothetical protein Strain318_002355 [Gemmatimonadaceae bacterium 'strain 318']
MRLKHGHTLVEALCALTLGGLLAVSSALTLGATRSALERAEARDIGGRAEREAVAVVRRALATGAAVLARGDTAVELDLLLGAGVACAVGARELLLPWPAAAGLTTLPTMPTADDLVAVRNRPVAAEDWHYAVVDSSGPRVVSGSCRAADGWRSPLAEAQPLLRVVLVDSVPVDIEPGAEVRFYRRGRFALYHAGRGEWMLGWRRCHPWSGACGPIQPVAGPLRSAGAGGFRVSAAHALTNNGWELRAMGVGGRGAGALVWP